MMHSSFWFGLQLDDFLIKDFSISSVSGVLILCAILLLFIGVYELLKLFLANVKVLSSSLNSSRTNITDNTELLVNEENYSRKKWGRFILELLLYVADVIAAYILMLIVMTYNGYIFLTAIVGSTIAFFFLGHKMMCLRIKARNLIVPCQHCLRASRNFGFESGSSEMVCTQNAGSPSNGTQSGNESVPHVYCSSIASVHL